MNPAHANVTPGFEIRGGAGRSRSARDWRCARKVIKVPVRQLGEPGAPRAAFNALSSGPAKVGPLLCLR